MMREGAVEAEGGGCWIYVARHAIQPAFKIGLAWKHPKRRISLLGGRRVFDLSSACIFHVPNCQGPEVERALKRRFSQHKVAIQLRNNSGKSEWLDVCCWEAVVAQLKESPAVTTMESLDGSVVENIRGSELALLPDCSRDDGAPSNAKVEKLIRLPPRLAIALSEDAAARSRRTGKRVTQTEIIVEMLSAKYLSGKGVLCG